MVDGGFFDDGLMEGLKKVIKTVVNSDADFPDNLEERKKKKEKDKEKEDNKSKR
jgi:hypothetical protein